jgi:hypothetical protein
MGTNISLFLHPLYIPFMLSFIHSFIFKYYAFKNSFFLLVGLGFELRASHLESRHSGPPVHFALVILKMGEVS